MSENSQWGAFLFCVVCVAGALWASAGDATDEQVNQALEVERLNRVIARMSEESIACRPPIARESLTVESRLFKGDKAPQVLCVYYRGGFGQVPRLTEERWATHP